MKKITLEERHDMVEPEEIAALLYAVGACPERMSSEDPRLHEYLCAIGTLGAYAYQSCGRFASLLAGEEPGEICAVCPAPGVETILDLPRHYPFTCYDFERVTKDGAPWLMMHLPRSVQEETTDHMHELVLAMRRLKRDLLRLRTLRRNLQAG